MASVKPVFLLLSMLFLLGSQEDGLPGFYQNNCNERLWLKADSSFYYTLSFRHGPHWAKGRWCLKGDSLKLIGQTIFDTVNERYERFGDSSCFDFSLTERLDTSYTIVSMDTFIHHFTELDAQVVSTSCCQKQLLGFQKSFNLDGHNLIAKETDLDCKRLSKQPKSEATR